MWGIAATERALEHEEIDAAELQPLLWDPLMHEVRDYLQEQGVAAATEQVLSSAETARALYQTALDAPSIDTEEEATDLVRQVSALLTSEVPLQADVAAVLSHDWRMLNLCMFPVIYRTFGEGVEKASSETLVL